MKSDAYKEAWGYATRFCSISEHCKSDIKTKIKRFELSDNEFEDLLKALELENYLNEQRYSNAFVNDKYRFSKWGRQKIRFSLQQKGINRTSIESALEIIDEKEYSKIIHDLLLQKKRSIKAASNFELTSKLTKFCLSRGFEYDCILPQIKLIGLTIDE
jgi:regulatory protein